MPGTAPLYPPSLWNRSCHAPILSNGVFLDPQQFRKCAAGNDYAKFDNHDPGSASCLHPITQALIHYPPYQRCTHGSVTAKRKAALEKCIGNVKNLLLAHPPQCEHGFAYTVFENAFLYTLLLLSGVVHTTWVFGTPTPVDFEKNEKDE